ncbi:MAG TPA: peptidase S58 family protein [Bacteroidetes bacterium]|nr:peptidase S58 family protein [Bacteroidota bacterium]
MSSAFHPGPLDALCDVPGLSVGHAQNEPARTGCTVVLPRQPAVTGVDIRGSAPGTHEVALLEPGRLVQHVHAICLTGGSSFGLQSAIGVQQFLEEKNIGFDVGVARVPIVPAAVIFDLAVGRADVRPDSAMGYAAARAATDTDTACGRIGAGTGATVGKILGHELAVSGGIGQASEVIGEGVIVAALTVVNPLGNIIDPASGKILAGARRDGIYVDAGRVMREQPEQLMRVWGQNTTLAVVATNAKLDKLQATKVAQMAHDGFGRVIHPAHTQFDGDLIFALSCGDKQMDSMIIGSVAADVVARSIIKAVSD